MRRFCRSLAEIILQQRLFFSTRFSVNRLRFGSENVAVGADFPEPELHLFLSSSFNVDITYNGEALRC